MPEITIVGAGPGGLASAKTLAEAGREVLVLEKNLIPGQKVCGGGLTVSDINYGVPESIVERRFDKIVFNLEGLKLNIAHKNIIWTIERTALGAWQARQAEKAGAEIKYNTAVTGIGKDYVLAGGKKLSFKYLIGADGSNSIVRKSLGLQSGRVAIGMEYEVDGDFDELEVIFNRRLFGSFYGWVFPYKSRAMVGAGGYPNELTAAEIKRNLEVFCAKRKYKINSARLLAAPLNVSYCGFKFGNKFLVGDAAGLVLDLTGEGIGPAIISGEEAARGILNPAYAFPKINDLLRLKERQIRIRNYMSAHPYLVRFGFLLAPLLIKNHAFKNRLLGAGGLR